MDMFLKPIADLVQPPWSYILGLGFLFILVAPRLVRFRREFLDVQMGRRHLEFEKLRLETLKLRWELEALSERKELPELKRDLQEIRVALQPAPKPKRPAPKPKRPTPERRGRFREWFTRHPLFARPFMLVLQAILGFLMVVFAVAMVAVSLAFLCDEALRGEWGATVFLVFLYGALVWASYKGFVASMSMRKELSPR